MKLSKKHYKKVSGKKHKHKSSSLKTLSRSFLRTRKVSEPTRLIYGSKRIVLSKKAFKPKVPLKYTDYSRPGPIFPPAAGRWTAIWSDFSVDTNGNSYVRTPRNNTIRIANAPLNVDSLTDYSGMIGRIAYFKKIQLCFTLHHVPVEDSADDVVRVLCLKCKSNRGVSFTNEFVAAATRVYTTYAQPLDTDQMTVLFDKTWVFRTGQRFPAVPVGAPLDNNNFRSSDIVLRFDMPYSHIFDIGSRISTGTTASILWQPDLPMIFLWFSQTGATQVTNVWSRLLYTNP